MSHRSSSRRRRHLERQVRLLQWAVIGVGGIAGLLVLAGLTTYGPQLDSFVSPAGLSVIIFGAALLAALLLAGVSASVGRVSAAIFNALKLRSAQLALGAEVRRNHAATYRTRSAS